MILEWVRAPHWSKHKYYLRRKVEPSQTPAAVARRLEFAEAAITARGTSMTEDLPPAAVAVRNLRKCAMCGALSDDVVLNGRAYICATCYANTPASVLPSRL